MKQIRLLTLAVLFAFLFNACSTSASTSIATVTATSLLTSKPTPTAASTLTPTETATAEPTETFALVDIDTSGGLRGRCTCDQITSGALVATATRLDKPAPAGAKNAGWADKEGGSTSDIELKSGSVNTVRIVGHCWISDAFLGLPDQKSHVFILAVTNTDGLWDI